jgi:acetolactate synthase-1/2/3 large subunit
MQVTRLADLDTTIREALAHPGAVVVDICVSENENCFPMIPSGAPHNEMILGPEQEQKAHKISREGQALV